MSGVVGMSSRCHSGRQPGGWHTRGPSANPTLALTLFECQRRRRRARSREWLRARSGRAGAGTYSTKSTPVSVLLYSVKVWLVCGAYTQVLMVSASVSTVNSRTGLVVSEWNVFRNE